MMTSEEGREEAGEKDKPPTGGTFKTGNPPMIHVSTDVLKEFMSSISSGASIDAPASSSETEVTTFASKSISISSAQKSAQILPTCAKSAISISLPNGVPASNSVKGRLGSLNNEEHNSSDSESSTSGANVPTTSSSSFSSVLSSLPSTVSLSFKGKINSSLSVSSKSVSISPSSKPVPLSSSSNSETKSVPKETSLALIGKLPSEKTSTSNSVLQEKSLSKKSEIFDESNIEDVLPLLEAKKSLEKSPSGNLIPPDNDFLHPGSPSSETSSQLSLNEFLLTDDFEENSKLNNKVERSTKTHSPSEAKEDKVTEGNLAKKEKDPEKLPNQTELKGKVLSKAASENKRSKSFSEKSKTPQTISQKNKFPKSQSVKNASSKMPELKTTTQSVSEKKKHSQITLKKKFTGSPSEKKKLKKSSSESKELDGGLSKSVSAKKMSESEIEKKTSSESFIVKKVNSKLDSEKDMLEKSKFEKEASTKSVSKTNTSISKTLTKTNLHKEKGKIIISKKKNINSKTIVTSKGVNSESIDIFKKSTINKITSKLSPEKDFIGKLGKGNLSPVQKRNIIKKKLLTKNIKNNEKFMKGIGIKKSPLKSLVASNGNKKKEEVEVSNSNKRKEEKSMKDGKIKANTSLKRVADETMTEGEGGIREKKFKKKMKKNDSSELQTLEKEKQVKNCENNKSVENSHLPLDEIGLSQVKVDSPKNDENVEVNTSNKNISTETNKLSGITGESETKSKTQTPTMSIKVVKKKTVIKSNNITNGGTSSGRILERALSADSKSINTSEGKGLSFSEALKSLAVEEPLLAIGKPQPLKPIAEIPSVDILCSSSNSLTMLSPVKATKKQVYDSTSNSSQTVTPSASTTDNSSDADNSRASQGKKRPINEVETKSSGLKADLKKIRVFNENEDKFKKGDVVRNVTDINRSLLEMSKMMEIRLQEEKALQEIENANNKPYDKDDMMTIDNEDLERRTAMEIKKARTKGEKKLQRIRRKDLEGLVIELFIDKVLYEHQLGQQRDLCKRLEATLETNRRKAAQFRKEVEDLKKVTQRLQAEHSSRKGQIIAPVKVKRSVGIQATPNIIEKGLMHTSSSGNIRVLSPSKKPVINQVSQPEPVTRTFRPTNSTLNNSNLLTPISSSIMTTASSRPQSNVNALMQVGQITPARMVAQSVGLASQPGRTTTTQMLMVNPSQIVVQQSTNGTVSSPLLPMGTTRLVRGPIAQIPTSSISNSGISTAVTFATTGLHNSIGSLSSLKPPARANFIDLTDDDEAISKRASNTTTTTTTTTGVLALQRSSSGGSSASGGSPGQFMNLPASSVSQFVLVPSTLGQSTTALVVGSMTSNNQTLTSGTPAGRNSILSGGTCHRFSSPATIVNTARLVVGTQLNGGNFVQQISRHPAPLPRAPPQQTGGFSKELPPLPILKLSHKDNSIVLSWNMAKTDEHERIASYQLYAYQEGTAPPTSSLWKKVGSVKALELPMACTLTQFMPGHIYHFAVRAVDIRSRLGPFSEPRSIRLGK